MSKRKAPNGAGSVFQRADGRWCAALYVVEADGRRVRRRVYGRSKQEVQDKLSDLRRKVDTGRPITPTHLTVEGFLDEWVSQIVSERVRPNTLAAYQFYIDKYLTPDLGAKRVGRLTAREVRLYLDQLKRRGVGIRTIRYVHATLRAALEDAMREELIEKNVAKLVRPPAMPKVDRHPLTVDEIRMLLKSTREDRLHAFFVVIALLGLRRSEALGLQWADVDLEGGTLSVRRGLHRMNGDLQLMEPKTTRSRRTIPLPASVLEALRAHRDQQERERVELSPAWPASDFVFTTPIGTPIDPDNCSKLVKRALQEAGVRHVRMHDFRHGCVSVLLAAGVPPRTVMEIVGHSGLEMTMNVYAHVTLDDKRAALDTFGSLFEDQSEDDQK